MCIILSLVKYKSVVLFVAYFLPEAVCKLKFFHNQQLKIIEKNRIQEFIQVYVQSVTFNKNFWPKLGHRFWLAAI